MKRIVWLLIVLLCMQCAVAEGVPEDGLYSVGVSSSAKMFRIVDCLLRVEDGKMTAVMTLSGSGYGYLYQGDAQQAEAAPVEDWTPYHEDESGRHCFDIEIPMLDAEIPMAAWSIRYEKWYDRTLQFFSNTLNPYCLIAPDGVYTAQIVSDTSIDGQSAILRSQDGKMTLEAPDFSMEIPSLDLRLPFENGWLKIESRGLETRSVSAADGVYFAQVQTDSALLRFTDCVLSVSDGNMTALLTAKNNNFDYLYMGAAADANANPQDWIAAVENADGAYTYEIPVSSLDNTLPIATYSAKKKLWYDREISIASQDLSMLDD